MVEQDQDQDAMGPNPVNQTPKKRANYPDNASSSGGCTQKKKKTKKKEKKNIVQVPDTDEDNVTSDYIPIFRRKKKDCDRKSVGELKLTHGVLEVVKDVIWWEEQDAAFENLYPYLNVALEKEGGKLMFLQKMTSYGEEKLVQLGEMELELKQASMMERKARKYARQVIDELHSKWFSD